MTDHGSHISLDGKIQRYRRSTCEERRGRGGRESDLCLLLLPPLLYRRAVHGACRCASIVRRYADDDVLLCPRRGALLAVILEPKTTVRCRPAISYGLLLLLG